MSHVLSNSLVFLILCKLFLCGIVQKELFENTRIFEFIMSCQKQAITSVLAQCGRAPGRPKL